MKRPSVALLLASIVVAGIASLALPLIASAQAPNQFIDTNIGTTLGLGTVDLRTSVIKLVQFVLGLMGLIAVVLIIYGGIIWMTAAGNEQRVEKAKQIITSAAIGLVVIILSWAIVIFVVNTTSNVTR